MSLQAAILRLIETHIRRVVTRKTMAAKQTQHDAADALLIETLDRHRNERTLTARFWRNSPERMQQWQRTSPSRDDKGRSGSEDVDVPGTSTST